MYPIVIYINFYNEVGHLFNKNLQKNKNMCFYIFLPKEGSTPIVLTDVHCSLDQGPKVSGPPQAFTCKMSLEKTCTDMKETENDHKQTQKDHKKMHNNCKVTQSLQKGAKESLLDTE